MLQSVWHLLLSNPRVLATVSSILCICFLGMYLQDPSESAVAAVKPLLGAVLWNGLGWYVAEYGESHGERVLGSVALLLACVAGGLGFMSYIF